MTSGSAPLTSRNADLAREPEALVAVGAGFSFRFQWVEDAENRRLASWRGPDDYQVAIAGYEPGLRKNELAAQIVEKKGLLPVGHDWQLDAVEDVLPIEVGRGKLIP